MQQAVDHQDHGACAWAIWSQQLLWSGEGRVPAKETDMYSGLVEVYGVYHSIQFLNRYVTQYPIIYHHNARVTVYCDNQGVIDRITGAMDECQPRDMIQDDYPVFQEIAILRQQLQPISFTFIHVDGHLDTKKPKRPLTVAETLNIECDTRAKKHSQTYPPY